MAFITCNHYSECLKMDVSFNAIIPPGCERDGRVLYLLHGLSDDHTAWCRYTSIERYANNFGINVIMPYGEQSFYSDMAYGGAYFSYISNELLNYTRKLFSLSHKCEDNFIAGLSMGGYGALKIALRLPGTFAAAASGSGVLDIQHRINISQWEGLKNVLGDNNTDLTNSPENLFYLLDNYPEDKVKPMIYQACGTEDFLYEDNLTFREKIKPRNFEHTYEEWSGAHNWDFWDVFIQKALVFMLNINNDII